MRSTQLVIVSGAPGTGKSRLASLLARASLAAGANVLLEGNFRPGQHEPAIRALWPDAAPGLACAQARRPPEVRSLRD